MTVWFRSLQNIQKRKKILKTLDARSKKPRGGHLTFTQSLQHVAVVLCVLRRRALHLPDHGVYLDKGFRGPRTRTRDSSTELRRRRIGSKGGSVIPASRRFFRIV